MFVKRLLSPKTSPHPPPQNMEPQGGITTADLDPRILLHYGIPSTASILAFDPIQNLLAVGTLDGRIKMIGGDNIEALFMSPAALPFKHLEFLHNQGFLASVSNENDVQIWDLEKRCIASKLHWGSNITAFSVLYGTSYMYIGDEYGSLSVLNYDAEQGKLLQMPYAISANSVAEAAEVSPFSDVSIVGVLPQPCSYGNRVLIAYENGLIFLWDVFEDRIVCSRGDKDLKMQDELVVGSSNDVSHEHADDASDTEHLEKEISSLCWASSDGSILAVGYVDGDIMFWNLSTTASGKTNHAGNSSNDVAKIQLSSASRRLPVIVLHWSGNKLHKDHRGQLFIYGGDQIGSEEVLTVLSLDWSSGLENVKCSGRVDITLHGSFADMILVPTAGSADSSDGSFPFVLTNPGQLHVYDTWLSASKSQHERKLPTPVLEYPTIVPTVEPFITVGKLYSVYADGESSKLLSEIVSAGKYHLGNTLSKGHKKWPLTGGIPSELPVAYNVVERMYIAGYQDGSVRIWDATFPTLQLSFVLGLEMDNIKVAGANAPISALEFCSLTLSLAIGNEYGLVLLYKLIRSSGDTNLQFVTQAEREVHWSYLCAEGNNYNSEESSDGHSLSSTYDDKNKVVQTDSHGKSDALKVELDTAVGSTDSKKGLEDLLGRLDASDNQSLHARS
ncbi:WD40 repeat, partial [Dillenia turbinata]